MSKQGTILSFDEARNGAGSRRDSSRTRTSARSRFGDDTFSPAASPRRSSSSVSAGRSAKRGSSPVAGQPAARPARNHAAVSARGSHRAPSPTAVPRPGSSLVAANDAYSARARRSSYALGEDDLKVIRGRSSQTANRAQARSGRFADAGKMAGSRMEQQVEEPQAEEAAGQESRFAKLRRQLSKAKADKAFTRQFGNSDDAARASAAEAGPRAAVYKGQMGSNQRRATRLQNNGAAADKPARKRVSLQGIAALLVRPKALVGMGVVACMLVGCAFLYPAAQSYYQAIRENDRLVAEYAALEQRNADLTSNVQTLQTDAGIEDQARQSFGYVKEGEQAVTVYGLESNGKTTSTSSSFTANVVSSDIKAPETWYSPVLDSFFGVE